jgi:hypothetical protein
MKETDYITLNKLILFTVEAFMRNALKEGLSNDPMHYKLVKGIDRYRVLCRFNKEQHDKILEFEKSAIVQKIKNEQMSHIVLALELMKQWVEQVPYHYRKNIALGVSNKALVKGRAAFALDMLELKSRDKERYTETRRIIDEAVVLGKHFFNYALEFL